MNKPAELNWSASLQQVCVYNAAARPRAGTVWSPRRAPDGQFSFDAGSGVSQTASSTATWMPTTDDGRTRGAWCP
jgi:hypothetical protein